jgi:Ca2+-binding RTX toxin-like protein
MIRGGRSFDAIKGKAGQDRLFGDDGNDMLQGGAGRDRLAGGGRDDTLEGGAGRDRLLGQAGEDHLAGGAGNDFLKGGRGADSFLFDGLRDEGRDRIADFQPGHDTIRIDGLTYDDLAITGGRNARVTLEAGTEIVLRGVSAESIDEDAFLFVLA